MDSVVIEPLDVGELMAKTLRGTVIANEGIREGVTEWIDSVLHDVAHHRRQVAVARFHNNIAGYMILKPWDQKISSIWVDPRFRGLGLGQRLYGMGVVQLGTPYPHTVFLHDMLSEMAPLMKTYALELDDSGPLLVLNPSDSEGWAHGGGPRRV